MCQPTIFYSYTKNGSTPVPVCLGHYNIVAIVGGLGCNICLYLLVWQFCYLLGDVHLQRLLQFQKAVQSPRNSYGVVRFGLNIGLIHVEFWLSLQIEVIVYFLSFLESIYLCIFTGQFESSDHLKFAVQKLVSLFGHDTTKETMHWYFPCSLYVCLLFTYLTFQNRATSHVRNAIVLLPYLNCWPTMVIQTAILFALLNYPGIYLGSYATYLDYK